MKLSIIIPFYNEAATLSEVVAAVKVLDLTPAEKEIVLVDDGSTDTSYEEASAHNDIILLRHDVNKGKGAAVATGIASSTGDYVIVQDADLELDPHDITTLINTAIKENAQVVYGSRILDGMSKTRSPIFFWGGRLVTGLCNLLYNTNLSDEACGYKLFQRTLLEEIPFSSKGFSWEPEITAKIAKRGIKIYEMPVSYFPRSQDQGKKLNWKDGVHACWTLIKYRFIA